MASGFTWNDDFKGGVPSCLVGSTKQASCQNNGGAWWSPSSGVYVCSIGGSTRDSSVATATADCSSLGNTVIKPLNFSEANALFAGVLVVVGLAFIFSLAIRFVLNR